MNAVFDTVSKSRRTPRTSVSCSFLFLVTHSVHPYSTDSKDLTSCSQRPQISYNHLSHVKPLAVKPSKRHKSTPNNRMDTAAGKGRVQYPRFSGSFSWLRLLCVYHTSQHGVSPWKYLLYSSPSIWAIKSNKTSWWRERRTQGRDEFVQNSYRKTRREETTRTT